VQDTSIRDSKSGRDKASRRFNVMRLNLCNTVIFLNNYCPKVADGQFVVDKITKKSAIQQSLVRNIENIIK
jgi:hypothetical protein